MRSEDPLSYVDIYLFFFNAQKRLFARLLGFLSGIWCLTLICFFGPCSSLISKTNASASNAFYELTHFSNPRQDQEDGFFVPRIKLAQKAKTTSVKSSQVIAVDIDGDREKTILHVTLTKPAKPEIFTLGAPDRVFIDFPLVEFAFTSTKPAAGKGLIQTYRYGEIGEQKARLVLDTLGPVMISKTSVSQTGNAEEVLLIVELISSKSENLPNAPEKVQATEKKNGVSFDKTDGDTSLTSKVRKYTIVIDPGHGGIDPGASGVRNLLEKNLVLIIAEKLRQRLKTNDNYTIVLTRNTDDFISLNERLRISQSYTADLFISLHADSFDKAFVAQTIKGATVYTLSEEASDAEAKAMAEKENASDLVAGIKISEQTDNAEVKNILMDLIMRETSNFSAEFARSLVTSMRSVVSLSRNPERSAKFKVLKQTHTPAVLLELGYISNPKEAEIMMSEEWQSKVCEAIAAAVDSFFKKRSLSGIQQ